MPIEKQRLEEEPRDADGVEATDHDAGPAGDVGDGGTRSPFPRSAACSRT